MFKQKEYSYMNKYKTCKISIFLLDILIGSMIILNSGCIGKDLKSFMSPQRGSYHINDSSSQSNTVEDQPIHLLDSKKHKIGILDTSNCPIVTLAKDQKLNFWNLCKFLKIITLDPIHGVVVYSNDVEVVLALKSSFKCIFKKYNCLPIQEEFILQEGQEIDLKSLGAYRLKNKVKFKGNTGVFIHLVKNCEIKVKKCDKFLHKLHIVLRKKDLQKVLTSNSTDIVLNKSITIPRNCKVSIKYPLIKLLEDCCIKLTPSSYWWMFIFGEY